MSPTDQPLDGSSMLSRKRRSPSAAAGVAGGLSAGLLGPTGLADAAGGTLAEACGETLGRSDTATGGAGLEVTTGRAVVTTGDGAATDGAPDGARDGPVTDTQPVTSAIVATDAQSPLNNDCLPELKIHSAPRRLAAKGWRMLPTPCGGRRSQFGRRSAASLA